MPLDRLDVVNDNDEIIGTENRSIVHERGLLHREVHTWFYTPQGEIIFQHRAKDKDSYPDLLDATMGGHVDAGETYEAAAIRETKEETGVELKTTDLVFLGKFKAKHQDPVTGIINNAFKKEYGYLFRGAKDDLIAEEGKSLGFEIWPIDKLFTLSDQEKKRFVPSIEGNFLEIFDSIRRLIP